MDSEILNIIALMSALMLLYACTVICAISHHRQWTPAWHQFWLSLLGIFPGMAGAVTGFWLFAVSHELNLILPSFVLLGFGALALLSLKKNFVHPNVSKPVYPRRKYGW